MSGRGGGRLAVPGAARAERFDHQPHAARDLRDTVMPPMQFLMMAHPRQWAFSGVLAITGCGDPVAGSGESDTSTTTTTSTSTEGIPTTGTDDTTDTATLEECPPIENPVVVEAALEPFADLACSEIIVDGLMPTEDDGIDDGQTFADLDFDCDVQAEEPSEAAWILGNCTGAGAPASGSLRVILVSDVIDLPLTLGEHVRVMFHGGYNFSEVHRSWSIRSDDGVLLALASHGIDLPPAELSAPLKLGGVPQPCGSGPSCGGYSGDADLRVASDSGYVKVPSGQIGTLLGEPSHVVLVPSATYGGDFACGIFARTDRYRFVVVADL